MAKKITSPRFRLTKANIPSVVKSAWISEGAIFAVAVLEQIPNIDFNSELVQIIAVGVSAWLINLVKEFVREK